MTTYHFPADAGASLPSEDPAGAPAAIAAHLDRLGLPHDAVRITRRGEAVRLEGGVPDAATRERILLAVGNLRGIGRVEDRLVVDQPAPGLLDGLGAFGRLPAGAANLAAARDALHHAEPEAGTVFGPGGSLLHTVQPGESLAEIAARHYGDAPDAEARILEANAPVLRDAAAAQPGLVLRLPPAR
jgi:nucleoid-associated protein YgaU